jgi:RNA polymerase sigma-70 factor (ECF subfamily)
MRQVHAFIRATVGDAESARDLTQEFFSRVLRGGAFDRAEPARGRFRAFLLGAVKHFLADMRDRERAAKRGGGAESVPFEMISDTSSGLGAGRAGASLNDALFDREWAISLLDRALLELEATLGTEGKSEQFAVLKPWLIGASTLSSAEAAARLGMN